MQSNLIIIADILNPPTDSLAVRSLEMVCKSRLLLNILIEVEQEYKDIYYNYLKPRGFLDFCEQLITPPEKEFGIRIDTDYNYPLTIKTQNIKFNNYINFLSKIAYLKKL